ncbi:MAG: hypothetical protein S4CHLAM7_11620 [Chlamydiae bacterium]|nr:hypothetical protein [Chlamydiota bacterium]
MTTINNAASFETPISFSDRALQLKNSIVENAPKAFSAFKERTTQAFTYTQKSFQANAPRAYSLIKESSQSALQATKKNLDNASTSEKVMGVSSIALGAYYCFTENNLIDKGINLVNSYLNLISEYPGMVTREHEITELNQIISTVSAVVAPVSIAIHAAIHALILK